MQSHRVTLKLPSYTSLSISSSPLRGSTGPHLEASQNALPGTSPAPPRTLCRILPMHRMAVTNIAFITFLALRNTPLAYLTTYTHDRLKVLHAVAGYTTILYAVLHAILISTFFDSLHFPFLDQANVFGLVAVCAMLVILLTTLFLRKSRFELFYAAHVTMYMLILVMVGLHQPLFSVKAIIVILFAAAIWFCDRVVRAARLIWYSYGNRATITPLPCGGTRVVLQCCPARAVCSLLRTCPPPFR